MNFCWEMKWTNYIYHLSHSLPAAINIVLSTLLASAPSMNGELLSTSPVQRLSVEEMEKIEDAQPSPTTIPNSQDTIIYQNI